MQVEVVSADVVRDDHPFYADMVALAEPWEQWVGSKIIIR